MSVNNKLCLLGLFTVIAVIGVFLLPPISQAESYHHFADDRDLWRIRNFGNVLSNLPFIFVGIVGVREVWKSIAPPSIRVMYIVLFGGVLLTALGSAYYHWNPSNETLVWDRIPMTIVFMSLLSATVAELGSRRLAELLLTPLVAIGVASVLWWHHTETLGKGDLRPYILVQFYPVVVVPLVLWLFYEPGIEPVIRCLVWVVVWYLISKIFEQLDAPVYHFTGISGHTLKHLAAAMSTWYLIVMFRLKYARSHLCKC
jgi:hypothetical protein